MKTSLPIHVAIQHEFQLVDAIIHHTLELQAYAEAGLTDEFNAEEHMVNWLTDELNCYRFDKVLSQEEIDNLLNTTEVYDNNILDV